MLPLDSFGNMPPRSPNKTYSGVPLGSLTESARETRAETPVKSPFAARPDATAETGVPQSDLEPARASSQEFARTSSQEAGRLPIEEAARTPLQELDDLDRAVAAGAGPRTEV